MAERYTPTMGMVRELERAHFGEPVREPLERDRCARRGLLNPRGRVSVEGREVLARMIVQSQMFGGRRG